MAQSEPRKGRAEAPGLPVALKRQGGLFATVCSFENLEFLQTRSRTSQESFFSSRQIIINLRRGEFAVDPLLSIANRLFIPSMERAFPFHFAESFSEGRPRSLKSLSRRSSLSLSNKLQISLISRQGIPAQWSETAPFTPYINLFFRHDISTARRETIIFLGKIIVTSTE